MWKGDILVADIEQLEQMDASEIYAKRLKAKEVLTSMSCDKFIYPIADGTVKLFGGDQDLRTSTLIWDRPDRGEEQGTLQGESDGSSSTHFETHRGMMVKLEIIWGPFQTILFTVITWNPESNCTCRGKTHFFFPLTYIDVTRNTDTSLGCNAGDKYWRLLERWWRSRIVRCMDEFHKIHCIKRKTTGWIPMVRVKTNQKTNDLQARHFVIRDVETHVRRIETKREGKVGNRENPNSIMPEDYVKFLPYWTWWWGIQAYNEKCS